MSVSTMQLAAAKKVNDLLDEFKKACAEAAEVGTKVELVATSNLSSIEARFTFVNGVKPKANQFE